MYELLDDGQILLFEEIITPNQTAIVGTHHTWGIRIQASYVVGTLFIEYRRPIIEGTEWQGQLVDDSRPCYLAIDDSAPLELTMVNGVCSQALAFETAGTYQLRIYTTFGSQQDELVVII